MDKLTQIMYQFYWWQERNPKSWRNIKWSIAILIAVVVMELFKMECLKIVNDMRKVVIKDLVAEVLEEGFFEEGTDIIFSEDYLIQITKVDGNWIVTNAVDGYGHNCRKEFENEKVTII